MATSYILKNGFKWSFDYAICKNHTGKMHDMQSISTSSLCNANCKKFSMNEKCVCAHCFSNKQQKAQPNTAKKLARNFEALTQHLFKVEEMPVINACLFRIEAFGDLYNVTQARNYLRLIKANPLVHFGWWTKSPRLIAEALKEEGMTKPPKNVTIIQSGFMLNTEIKKAYDWIDKTFIVYDNDINVKINCGARDCIKCQRCYKKNTAKTIREKLK